MKNQVGIAFLIKVDLHTNRRSHFTGCHMQELSRNEVELVSGGTAKESAAAFGLGAGIGAAAFTSTWGTMAVGAAFAISPLSVIALAGCAGYAGWRLLSAK
ncbi:hypothetical protein RBA41_06190 [Massilia sp. CCM 9210]|uniref:hypothetical protein n=1 Tax=Massilia scottii TaxID=3057166 RepID=UPI002796B276|nr:hypothetical protein [Massilia sp. CCM 9210]MDQ1812890.1 hypothetical protein [Massilia sp. CCM 9210]